MARAWEQAGAANDANALLRRAQLARELGSVVLERHLAPLAPAGLLAMTQPAHARIQLTEGSVEQEVRASRVPEAAMSARDAPARQPAGPRRAARRADARLNVLAAVDRVAMRPPPAAPSGMVMMASAAATRRRPRHAPRALGIRLRVQLLERLAPETTVLARTVARIEAPASTWTRPDPLAPATTGPRFSEPMYDGLQKVAPWLFLPGVEKLEADGVALLETTPRVIEAYMAGLNHELSRELLWREFPAALTGTAFRQFWDVSGSRRPEALPISRRSRTGAARRSAPTCAAGTSQLVLVVRGELLRRYPTTTIYAARATANGALDPATRLAPMFRGALSPDIVFVGFALREEAALGIDPAGPGWYFVFEEYPGEPRFGFDEVAAVDVARTADQLAWKHVPVTASGHADASKPLLSAAANVQGAWSRNAAATASLTFQQPFRVALHATRLLRRSEP